VRHEILEVGQFGVFHEPAQWRIEDNLAAHTEAAGERC
jgi:hypothetical protein